MVAINNPFNDARFKLGEREASMLLGFVVTFFF